MYSDKDSNPSEVVSAFRQIYLQGRSLNTGEGDVDSFVEGETYNIMVSRNNICESMTDKLSATLYDPRLPLKVDFYGGAGIRSGRTTEGVPPPCTERGV